MARMKLMWILWISEMSLPALPVAQNSGKLGMQRMLYTPIYEHFIYACKIFPLDRIKLRCPCAVEFIYTMLALKGRS